MNPNKGPRFTVGGQPLPPRSFLENQRVEATESEEIKEEPKMNRAQRRAYLKQLKKAAKKRGAKW